MRLSEAIQYMKLLQQAGTLPEVVQCMLCGESITPPLPAQDGGESQCEVCGGWFCHRCHLLECEGEASTEAPPASGDGGAGAVGTDPPPEPAGEGDVGMTPRRSRASTETMETDSLSDFPSRGGGAGGDDS